MNPWHEIPVNLDKDHNLNCIIEIPMFSKIKYELDKDTGLLKVDRILYSSVHYPGNYGFFPQSFCDDGDPLDVLVLGQLPVVPMALMRVRPVGVIAMKDQNKGDDKVIAVHSDDPEYADIKTIKDIPKHKLIEIKHFFESYKMLEKKKVEINAIGDEKKAMKVVKEALELYNKTYR
jgi:inorganic pyrophosphatase